MTECFTAVKPKTFSEFYSIAQTAESNFKRTFHRNNDNQLRNRPKFETNDKNKRKPPNACRICENLGYKNRFHWANDCRNRKPNNQQAQTNVKSVATVSATNELPENDISKIDLND